MVIKMENKTAKWRVLIPREMSETFRCALYDLYGIIDAYLPYPLAVSCEDDKPASEYAENLIILGTASNGSTIKKLAEDGFFTPAEKSEGYAIKAAASPFGDESKQCIVICGTDDAGLLYGVHAFDRRYIRNVLKYNGYHFNHRYQPFVEPCLPFDVTTSPKIDKRGIWTWGHMIYDYRAYLKNMSTLGMNLLVMWNDSVPINAREILSEAHKRGIKIYWGFSCSWGEKVDPNDPADTEKWTKRVLDTYRSQYAPLGGDGIYFQAFTETSAKDIGGKPIAQLVTDWANAICSALHGEFPTLDIQFGIHATSIGESYGTLAGIDDNVAVMWEDCGGFPYSYDPGHSAIPNAGKALDYTRSLARLCGDRTKFAAVLKGFTVLDWSHFQHYHGDVVVGEASESFLKQRTEFKKFTWQYVRPYWMNGAKQLKQYMKTVAEAGIRETAITALIEDGMFECHVDPCVMLYAEMMWDWDRDTDALIAEVTHSAEI